MTHYTEALTNLEAEQLFPSKWCPSNFINGDIIDTVNICIRTEFLFRKSNLVFRNYPEFINIKQKQIKGVHLIFSAITSGCKCLDKRMSKHFQP